MSKDKVLFNDPNFNKLFPETYDWRLIDNISLSKIGIALMLKILDNLQTSGRNLVPGLRVALREMAKQVIMR